jgi:osmoprotectant transport system permease protein
MTGQIWLGTLLGALTALFGSFAVVSKNRVFIGKPTPGTEVFGGFAYLILMIWFLPAVLTYAGAKIKDTRMKNLAFSLISLIPILLAVVNAIYLENTAYHFDRVYGSASRVSPGYSFWLAILSSYIILDSCLKNISWSFLSNFIRNMFWIAFVILILSGSLNHVSVLKEYFNNKDKFNAELSRHITLSFGSTIAALFIGFFLGYIASKRKSLERPVFTFLNTLQVIPTLSFIGLIMPPLGYIGERFEAAAALGIKGIGWAPAVIVLTAYALYPISRNVYAALKLIDKDLVEAAEGLGLSRLEIIWKIEIPMALPLVLGGLRVALVQASAGTIVAALVGAGGLGVFIFLGLAQTAQDLVLLGVIPIVLLTFAYTAFVNILEQILMRGRLVS